MCTEAMSVHGGDMCAQRWCMCTEVVYVHGGDRPVSGDFLTFFFFFLRQGPLLNPGCYNLTRLAG